jgi:propionyl-CoA carboxylase beta chain
MRKLYDYLPLASGKPLPIKQTKDPYNRVIPVLDNIVPEDPNRPYDMRTLIRMIVDEGDFDEMQPEYARNIVVGFGRMEGRPVGIVAN